MSPKLILLTMLYLFCFTADAQVNGYAENVRHAEDFIQKKDYNNAAKSYSIAFALNNDKATTTDRYNAACAWSLSGNKDSAFYHLFRVAEKDKYDNYTHITTDPDLVPLYPDNRWSRLLSIVKSNKEKVEANYIKPVVAILDTILKEDQIYRKDIVQKIQKLGMESPEVKAQLKLMSIADSINLIKIEKILDQYGWLGFDKVGTSGALTIFLVIQHSPLNVQQKYLPLMREAVAKKQARPANLALLEDRVALGEGRKQTYGSQLATDKATGKTYLQALEDPDNVDKRRAAVGLGPLADYLKQFNLVWDVEAYKKEEAEREKNVQKK